MTDREKLVLGWSGGLATLVIGYLIWRHEHAISQADAAKQQAAQAAQDQYYAQEVQQAVSQPYATGGFSAAPFYSSPATAATDTGSQIDSTQANTDLAAILAAFYPNQAGSVASQGGNGNSVTNSAGGSVPSSNNIPTTQPITGPPPNPPDINSPQPPIITSGPSTIEPNPVGPEPIGHPVRWTPSTIYSSPV